MLYIGSACASPALVLLLTTLVVSPPTGPPLAPPALSPPATFAPSRCRRHW
ncbi:hypothetical protein I547_0749 [Mycobacterium kansasii 824]|nr:hypothetical protein I547_0749 [Mycobacterium kansasii 824]